MGCLNIARCFFCPQSRTKIVTPQKNFGLPQYSIPQKKSGFLNKALRPRSLRSLALPTAEGLLGKAFRRQYFFLFPYVLLICYHHLRAKLGMYIALCIFLKFWQVCYIWSKNLIINLTDFVNRKYENPLGIDQDGINIGGSGVSGGNKGCHGQAHVEPKFLLGDIV